MWMEELPNGKYKYYERYKDPYTEKPRRTSITLNSKSNQAKKKAQQELQIKIARLTSVANTKKKTFKETYEKWFSVYKNIVKAKSSEKVKYSMTLIKDYIEDDFIISKIDHRLLQDMINDLYYEKDYSYNYVSSIKSHLSLIFNYAEKEEYISSNPMNKVSIQRKPKTKDDIEKITNKYLELSEAKLLLDEMRKNKRSERNADIVEFIMWTGLRIGELLALKEENYDGKFIYVAGTLDYTTNKYSDGVIGTTKNEQSTRKVELPDKAIKIIEKVLNENKFSSKTSGGFTFCSYTGNPVAIQTVNTSLKNYVEKIELNKHVTTHVFRHTHVSLLAEKNIPLKSIMDRVGHSDMETTTKIYTHVTDKMKERVIEELNSIDF